MKKIVSHVVLLLILIPGVILAQVGDDPSVQFQTVFTVPAQDILVPTVVEINIPDAEIERSQFLVIDQDTREQVASRYEKTYEVEPVAYQVAVEGRMLNSLTDSDRTTSEIFPVSADTGGTVQFEIVADTVFSASSLVLDLARNVALPTSVSIEAVVSDVSEIVVAKTKVFSTRIAFPETISDTWVVTLEYAQPLRLTELQFVQTDVVSSTEHSLRFLAQPETVYEVYFNPESSVTLDRVESGDLTSNDDVLVAQEVSVASDNITFVQSDVDGDGIPDQTDNCVTLANEDQVDLNNNGRGDACDDFDRDGVINSVDNCINQPNRSQADEDGDTIGDACDDAESRVTEKYGWIPWAAMGVALSVFALLFAIVLRRMEKERLQKDADESLKHPTSDL